MHIKTKMRSLYTIKNDESGGGGRGEKWPKPCMHIWIIKQKNKKKLQ
jgi:hypothetical protein